MYDAGERVRRIKLRGRKLGLKGENRLIGGLLSLCVTLSAFLVGIIGNMAGKGYCYVEGFYGSTLMYENAGSHVLVGVISFAAAVVITVLCIRNREKNKKNKNSKKDE